MPPPGRALSLWYWVSWWLNNPPATCLANTIGPVSATGLPNTIRRREVAAAPEGLPGLAGRARRGGQKLPLGLQLLPVPSFAGQRHALGSQVGQQPIALLKQPLEGRGVTDGQPLGADALLHAPIPLDQHRLHRRAQGRLLGRGATERVACHGDGHRPRDAGRGELKAAPAHDDLAGLDNRSNMQRRSAVGLLPLDLQGQRLTGL